MPEVLEIILKSIFYLGTGLVFFIGACVVVLLIWNPNDVMYVRKRKDKKDDRSNKKQV